MPRQRVAGQGGLGPARRRRAGGGGITFPARARPAGITTRFPSRVRTAKDPASACSRMPSTSVICSLSPGPGRQRITTRLPTSAGVSRTTSRYRMPVTYSQGGGPGCRAAGHRATADAATIRYLTHGHVALPAGDVAGDVVGVVGQRAGLGGAAGGAELSWSKNFAFSPVNWAHARARRLRRRSPRPGTPARRRHSRRTRRSGCRASAGLRRCSRPGIHRRRPCPWRRCRAR